MTTTVGGAEAPPPQPSAPRAPDAPRTRRTPHLSHLSHLSHRVYRSFNVVSDKSAKMIPTITNRVITFGSLQPTSSKW
jgi:hypothetical protein